MRAISIENNNGSIGIVGKLFALLIFFLLQISFGGHLRAANTPGEYEEMQMTAGQEGTLLLKNASLHLPSGALKSDMLVSMQQLLPEAVASLNQEIINMTPGAVAYRCGPSGSTFPVALTLELDYDPKLLSERGSVSELAIFFYQPEVDRWMQLMPDTVLVDQRRVRVKIDHFTDFITGIIKTPESPETQGYKPTEIKDLKAADPSAGIRLIEMPKASQMGGANLSYPIRLPAGRNGLQPELTASYSNQGGHSWLGLGWSLDIPSIDIETQWGVPRYTSNLETETYTYKGSQLWPVAHRSAFRARSGGDKQFYPRVEGGFERIIRHGNRPSDCWWEVTDKNGTTYSYGGRAGRLEPNAVLTDAAGNIGKWCLVETRDANDNFILYKYRKGEAPGGGASNKLYIDEISYTGHGSTEGKYRVRFTTDRERRDNFRIDVDLNCRLGFPSWSAELLKEIEVRYGNELVSRCRFTQEEGAFYKTLLTKIEEFDAEGALFFEHGFDYFDEVRTNNTYDPFEAVRDGRLMDDQLTGDLIAARVGFSNEVSPLGSSQTKNSSFGGAFTIGFPGSPIAKNGTVGGNYSRTKGSGYGITAFTDIDGNGLPDKVMRIGDGLFYRPNLTDPGNDQLAFGDVTPVFGVKHFSQYDSKGHSKGLEANISPFSLSKGSNKSVTSTHTYFSDFNSDGLIDVARRGKVYFGYFDGAGLHKFSTNSEPSPSPIISGAAIDDRLLNDDDGDQVALEDEFPLHDVVRVWIAPKDGKIRISEPITYLPGTGEAYTEYRNREGVVAKIQHKDEVLDVMSVGDTLDLPITDTPDVDPFEVELGDEVFFRLQSKEDGSFDRVNWSPEIQYVDEDTEENLPVTRDANNEDVNRYNVTEDFHLFAPQSVIMPLNGKISISHEFFKPATSDDVIVEVLKTDTLMDTEVIYRKRLGWNDEVRNLSENLDVAVGKRDQITFRMRASTNIAWSQVLWKPTFCYISADDPDMDVFDDEGNPVLCMTPAVEADLYGRTLRVATPYEVEDTGRVTVQSNYLVGNDLFLQIEDVDTVYFTLSLKGVNKLYGSSTGYYIPTVTSLSPGILRLPPYFRTAEIPAGEKLFVEVHYSHYALAEVMDYPFGAVIEVGNNGTDFIKPGAYSKQPMEQLGFSPMHRGWGRFVYNGNRERREAPIDRDLLIFEMDNYSPSDPGDISDPDNLDAEFDPTKEILIVMASDPANDRWIGADDLTYISRDSISSSRFGEDDLKSITLGAVMSGLQAPVKKSVSTGDSKSVGVGLGGLPINVGYNDSNGESINSIEVMDMNADGYLDLLKNGVVQYTLPTGGLMESLGSFSDEIGTHFSTSSSKGATAGGSLSTAAFGNDKGGGGPVTINIGTQGAKGADNAQKQSSTGASVNGGVNFSNDQTEQTWIDVNGDGLQDLVKSNGMVRLNIGYSFLPEQDWDFDGGIRKGKTEGKNLGLGLSFANRSISFGISLNNSKNFATRAFQDVTGDGLTDRLRYNPDNQIIYMAQNLGTGFEEEIPWLRGYALDEGSSIGESANIAFTVCINLFFVRICVNPQFSAGQGLSRQRTQFADVNGDGYPDFLESRDGDGDLRVHRSKIGKTNMLRSVKRPLGGEITLDYQRTGNTYEQPNSVWVLSDAIIYDGLSGDGADEMRYHYTYEDGYKDRHERQFYGFAKVTTEELDTENNDAVYRRKVEEYRNDGYYTKGLKMQETTYDEAGRIFARMDYTYEFRNVFNGSELTAEELLADNGIAFPAKISETTFFHEGEATALLERRTDYDYDNYGNVTFYRDSGDGTTEDWVAADVSYHEMADAYIVGTPSAIEVNTSKGLMRKREASIDAQGNMTQIRRFLANGDFAVHDLEYDNFGNLEKMIRPANYRDERMSFEYTYDEQVQTYVTKVKDAFGYSSEASYDYRFGQKLSTTDLNGNEIHYTIDAAGRMAMVTGPYEIAAGVPYTIKMEYHPEAVVPYALTRHYEPDHPGSDIMTYTFMDGNQRPVQVKKTGVVSTSNTGPGRTMMIVSGRQVFDAFGRTTETYYPRTENLGMETTFNALFDEVRPTRKVYDVLDREIEIILPDGATSRKTYGIQPNGAGDVCLYTSTTDALGNRKDAYLDVRERQCAQIDFGPDGPIQTTFTYNPISELLTVTDVGGNFSSYTYDLLGRKLSFQHPDAGRTDYHYDLSDNLLRKQTEELRITLGEDAFITYDYEFNRPISIAYPKHFQNNVRYKYGEPGAPYNRTGRIVLQEDASGGQEFFYGPLGEVEKTIRTIVVNPINALTYISESKYDTWNRIKEMVYPDGEKLTYAYNEAGKLQRLTGFHEDTTQVYVEDLRYDKFEQRIFLAYGNNTSTTYTYEPLRRRLSQLNATSGLDGNFLAATFRYDDVDNILGITNTAELTGAGQVGGRYEHTYAYDELYRLESADGSWTRGGQTSRYNLNMEYDNLQNITAKTQRLVRNDTEQPLSTYVNTYAYESERPHLPERVGELNYNYDANGNQTEVENRRQLVYKQMIWDEENRLQGVADKGYVSRYTYDAKGERVIKSHGGVQGVFFDGVEAGFVNHYDNFTAYVSPYLVARRDGFSKHYFIGTQRIASRLGSGKFLNNALSRDQGITAGQQDYLERARLIRQSAQEFYAQFDGAPGHPIDPDRPVVVIDPIFIPDSSYTAVPAEWQSLLPEGPPAIGAPPGHPIWRIGGTVRDSAAAGYGWVGEELDDVPRLYFYHPDHLGSSAYITDIDGRVNQHVAYMPFGETFVEEFSFSTQEARQNYLFNGKELDRETGLYYYGARYYDPTSSIWLSLDPMMEKYPGWSPLNYVLHNPVKLVDPDGLEPSDPVLNPRIRPTDNGVKGGMYGNTRNNGKRHHGGIDLLARVGTPVMSIEDGSVYHKGKNKSFGNYLIVSSKLKSGDYLLSLYAHLEEESPLKNGQTVKGGDEIGRAGKSGNAKDMSPEQEHLHLETRVGKDGAWKNAKPEDPRNHIPTKFNEDGTIKNNSNSKDFIGPPEKPKTD